MIKEWFKSLSHKQKWILYAGFALVVIFTLIHNPLSGYHNYSRGIYTRDPIGESSRSHDGYLSLGKMSAYGSFVIATSILTGAAIHLSGRDGE